MRHAILLLMFTVLCLGVFGCAHRQQELDLDLERTIELSEFWTERARDIWERWEDFETE